MLLTETPGNPAPRNAEGHILTTPDGANLRALRFLPDLPPKGTAILLSGRTEYVEKYFETINDLIARDFAVVTFDWRGQGGSDRMLVNALAGHVTDFSVFDADFDFVLDSFAYGAGPGPRVLIAHSMGGHLAIRALHRRPYAFAAAVLSAPMLGVKTAPFPPPIARAIAFLGSHLGLGETILPTATNLPQDEAYLGNVVTSDRGRFERNVAVLKARPELGLSAPTYGWIEAAYRSLAEVTAPGYAEAIPTPVLIVGAGHDRIVDTDAAYQFAMRLPRGEFALIGDAEHEILQENDGLRAAFWSHADAFLTRALQSGMTDRRLKASA